MGRYSWGWKTAADNLRSIDINWLIKAGKYTEGSFASGMGITWTTSGFGRETKNSIDYDIDLCAETSFLRLHYTINRSESENSINVDYQVFLEKTPCNIGGFRYWFICPGDQCSKRVTKLYFLNKYFLCRHCHNLTYESRNTNKRFRDLDKLFRLEDLETKILEKLRTKYYRGLPTKKYQKLLNFDKIHSRYFKWP
jgi:hypothetical protein